MRNFLHGEEEEEEEDEEEEEEEEKKKEEKEKTYNFLYSSDLVLLFVSIIVGVCR